MTDILTTAAWLLLLAIGGLLVAILFKVVFLLQSASEFLTLARYELYPMLRELRHTVTHLESISSKASSGVSAVERGVQFVSPRIREKWDHLQSAYTTLGAGVSSVLVGLKQSFNRYR